MHNLSPAYLHKCTQVHSLRVERLAEIIYRIFNRIVLSHKVKEPVIRITRTPQGQYRSRCAPGGSLKQISSFKQPIHLNPPQTLQEKDKIVYLLIIHDARPAQHLIHRYLWLLSCLLYNIFHFLIFLLKYIYIPFKLLFEFRQPSSFVLDAALSFVELPIGDQQTVGLARDFELEFLQPLL